MVVFNMLKTAFFKQIKRVYRSNKKAFIIIFSLLLIFSFSYIPYSIFKIKENDNIYFLDSKSEAILGNKNPLFEVNFGKREEPENQWVRFEAKASSNNPFDEKNENIFTKIIKFFKPKKEYGIEMSLQGVKLGDVENLELEAGGESVKSVAEIIGTDSVKTSTELIESGRLIGEYSEEAVSKKTVVNKNVADGVDIEYQILEGLGLKEEIVIRDLEAYSKPCEGDLLKCKVPLNEFIFEIKLDEGLELKKGWYTLKGVSTETYYFVDRDGNYVAHFLPNWAIDSSGNKTYDVISEVEEKDGNYKVEVSVDINWLFSSDRVYPVRIDPSIVHDSKHRFEMGMFERTVSTDDQKVELKNSPISEDTLNLVGRWKLDEASGEGAYILDSSINGNNGTPNGTTFTNGYVNGARSFNGTSDYIDLGTSINSLLPTGTADRTVEAWIYMRSCSTTVSHIFHYGNNATNQAWGLVVHCASSGFGAHEWTITAADFVGSVPTNQWVHLAITLSAGNVKDHYMNGVKVGTLIKAPNTTIGSWSAKIGTRISPLEYFDGVIDEVSVYNKALSPIEIASHYRDQANYYVDHDNYSLSGLYTSDTLDIGEDPRIDSFDTVVSGVTTYNGEVPFSTTGLISQWNFNETSGTTLASTGSCGSSCNGTLQNFSGGYQDTDVDTGWTNINRKWGSGALIFDGTDDYVLLDHSSEEVSPTWSLEGWVYPKSCTGTPVIYSKSNNNGFFYRHLYIDNTFKLKYSIENTHYDFSSDYICEPYKWYYLSVTYNSNTGLMDFYVDGKKTSESTIAGEIRSNIDRSVFGTYASNNPQNFFNGIIDSFRLYNRVLTTAEILSNYQAGNIEFQYRTSSDGSTWNAWKGGSERSVDKINDESHSWRETSFTNTKLSLNLDSTKVTPPTAPTNCLSYKPILIDNLGSNVSLTDYQVKVVVPFSSGMSADFSNLRFTNSSGDYLFYWIEKYTASTTATVWIKVDTVNANTSTYIYMWYNGCSAGAVSNGANTFIFFDDFIGSSIDTGKWTITNNTGWSVTGGELRGSNTTGILTSVQTFSSGVVLDIKSRRVTTPTNGYMIGGFWLSTSNGIGFLHAPASDYYRNNSSFVTYGTAISAGNNLYTTFEVASASLVHFRVKNYDNNAFYINVRDIANGVSAEPIVLGRRYDNANTGQAYEAYWDWILVRKYAEIIPEVRIINAESQISKDGSSLRISQSPKEKDEPYSLAYYKMDENSNGTCSGSKDVCDSSISGYHATASGASIVEGYSNKGRSFNGTSDHLVLPAGFDNFRGGLTIELWAYPTNTASWARFVDLGNGAPSNNIFFARNSTTDGLSYRVYSGTTAGTTVTATGTLTNNEWNHYAVTQSSSGAVIIYKNGVQVGSGTTTLPVQIARSSNYIGRSNWTADGYYGGMMDDVRILNRPLTPDEIAESYRMSKDLYLTKEISNNDLSTDTKIPFWIASDQLGNNLDLMIGNSKYANYQADEFTKGLWLLDEPTGASSYIKDSSGNGNNGTPTGTTYVEGKIGGARSFNGTSDLITVPENDSLDPSSITIDAWLKPSSFQAGNFVDKGGNSGYRFRVLADGRVEFHDRGTTNSLASKSTLLLDQWNHVAVVADYVGIQIYINGRLDASKSTAYGGVNTATNLILGRFTSASEYYRGAMDLVRISSTSRSPQEIKEAYEVGRRIYPITVNFKADLQSSNLISNSSDYSFTISEIAYGKTNNIENLNKGDKVIVRENINGVEYIVQGYVNTLNLDTGAVTVVSWESGGTFPSGGYTTNAKVFKWQEEIFDIRDILPEYRNSISTISFRLVNNTVANYWIDDIRRGKYIEETGTGMLADADLDSEWDLGTGPNGRIFGMAVQSDGKILIGGDFTSYNGTAINRIARLNTDGSLDTSFTVGTGPSSLVRSIGIQSDGKIILGGSFTTFNGNTAKYLCRLNSNGTFDSSFTMGTGADSFVDVVRVQSSDDKILLGGDFGSYYTNSVTRYFLARANANGTVDTGFYASDMDGVVYDILVQPDGKIIVGGNFYEYQGTDVYQFARLESDGDLDPTFLHGQSVNGGSVGALGLQSDGKIIVGGSFTSYFGSPAYRLMRINEDGTRDTTFNIGSGPNGRVEAVTIQLDGKIIIGGSFNSYNGVPINGIARINLDGSLDESFLVGQGVDNIIYQAASQSDGKILLAGNFTKYDNFNDRYITRINGEYESLNRYFQYRAFLDTYDNKVTPSMSRVQIDYMGNTGGPTMDQIMRHGKWFNNGQKQKFWWVQ